MMIDPDNPQEGRQKPGEVHECKREENTCSLGELLQLLDLLSNPDADLDIDAQKEIAIRLHP